MILTPPSLRRSGALVRRPLILERLGTLEPPSSSFYWMLVPGVVTIAVGGRCVPQGGDGTSWL